MRSRSGSVLAPLPSLEAAVMAGFFVLALAAPKDADTYLHLATGRYVLESGVPAVDPFSHTIAGQAWLAHEWLVAALFEVLHRVGGLGLVVWACAMVCLLSLAALRRLFDTEEIRSPLARLSILLFAGVCMRNVVLARPHIFTVLFLVLEMTLVARVRRGGSLVALAALPPLFTVWGNMHGGFVLGGLPLGMAGLDALQDWRRGEAGAARRFLALVCCGLACIAALVVNPHGAALLGFPFAFDARAAHLALVEEWAIPDYRYARLQEGMLLALMAAPLLWPARARLGEVAGIVAGAHLALQAVRNQFLLGLTGAVPLGRSLQEAGRGFLAPVDRKLERVGRGKGTLLPLTALALGALIWAPRQEFVDPARFPVAAAEWIEAAKPDGKMFNEYDAGGYLIWRLRDVAPVFIDGRIEIYARHGLLADYLAIADAKPGWDGLLRKYKVGYCVVHDNSALAQALAQAPDWSVGFQGAGIAVYVLDLGKVRRD